MRLDTAQQADVQVALDDLEVFMTWARQVSAVRPVTGAGTGRRQRQPAATR